MCEVLSPPVKFMRNHQQGQERQLALRLNGLLFRVNSFALYSYDVSILNSWCNYRSFAALHWWQACFNFLVVRASKFLSELQAVRFQKFDSTGTKL